MFKNNWSLLLVLVGFIFVSSLSLAQTPALNEMLKLPKVEDTLQNAGSDKIDNIINYAKKYLGTPYRYAGMTPSGFDCSGFINYIMGNFGISLARSSYSMAEYGKIVKLANIQKGDLMFFKGSSLKSSQIGHVGMVIEVTDGIIKFIHAANGGVQITTFNNSKYYVPRYIKATRLDYGNK